MKKLPTNHVSRSNECNLDGLFLLNMLFLIKNVRSGGFSSCTCTHFYDLSFLIFICEDQKLFH